MQVIKMYISNSRLWRYTSGVITEDSTLKFEFNFKTEDWNSVETKTVVFSYKGKNYETTLDENNQCYVRKEALYAPYFKVSVYGGGIITNTVTIPIEPCSSTEYTQLFDLIQSKSDAEHKHDERYYTENEAEDRFISEEELIQPDWNQNDSTSVDYVKNRTHYEEEILQWVEYEIWNDDQPLLLTEGQRCKILYNTIYDDTFVEFYNYDEDQPYILTVENNNGTLYIGDLNKSIYPFYITATNKDINFQWERSISLKSIHILLEENSTIVHKLDSKFIPGVQIIPINQDGTMTAEDFLSLNDGFYIIYNAPFEYANGLVRVNDGCWICYDWAYYYDTMSIIDGQFTAIDYGPLDGFGYEEADKIIGRQGTGNNAEIFNDYLNNIASGNWSHAEGYNTFASGTSSHVEGDSCKSIGPESHAEGLGTIAEAEAQHVQGKFNISDEDWAYAHIVGNGFDNSNRSNAHTLDWSGNAWFAGNIKIGGTGQNDATAKELATKDDVDSQIASLKYYTLTGTTDSPIDLDDLIEPGMYMVYGSVICGSDDAWLDDYMASNRILAVLPTYTQDSDDYTWQYIVDPTNPCRRKKVNGAWDLHKEYDYRIATNKAIGGIKADEKQDTDTIPARIGTDGKLYVEYIKPKSATVTLLAANWVGEVEPYSQVVQISGVTTSSKIDLQPTPVQLVDLQNNEITLMIANDNGTVTAYALGSKPTKDYEMQVSITEMKIV